MDPSVAVDVVDEEGRLYNIKIATDAFEVNVLVPVEQAALLDRVRQTPWASGALQIGTSAGAPAWWCIGDADREDPDRMSILVGEDDQSWDIAVQVPIATIDEVLREIGAAQAGS